jgi:hypothetical protein
VPYKATIYNIVTKLRSTGSVLDKKKSRKRHVLTEEKLDGIGARLEASPKKSSFGSAVWVGRMQKDNSARVFSRNSQFRMLCAIDSVTLFRSAD